MTRRSSQSGFDVAPVASKRPRPRGLSRSDKTWLALAVFALLGATAVVADVLQARKDPVPPSQVLHPAEQGRVVDLGNLTAAPSGNATADFGIGLPEPLPDALRP